MESELRAYAAIREAARPGATLAQLATLFEQTLLADGWELGRSRAASISMARVWMRWNGLPLIPSGAPRKAGRLRRV